MTIAPDRPRTRDVERARRDALRPLVQDALLAVECARDALVGHGAR